jgi:hypothetical protein
MSKVPEHREYPRKCDDCREKYPSFGNVADGKKRWCSACAKSHPGCENLRAKKCEDRGLEHID